MVRLAERSVNRHPPMGWPDHRVRASRLSCAPPERATRRRLGRLPRRSPPSQPAARAPPPARTRHPRAARHNTHRHAAAPSARAAAAHAAAARQHFASATPCAAWSPGAPPAASCARQVRRAQPARCCPNCTASTSRHSVARHSLVPACDGRFAARTMHHGQSLQVRRKRPIGQKVPSAPVPAIAAHRRRLVIRSRLSKGHRRFVRRRGTPHPPAPGHNACRDAAESWSWFCFANRGRPSASRPEQAAGTSSQSARGGPRRRDALVVRARPHGASGADGAASSTRAQAAFAVAGRRGAEGVLVLDGHSTGKRPSPGSRDARPPGRRRPRGCGSPRPLGASGRSGARRRAGLARSRPARPRRTDRTRPASPRRSRWYRGTCLPPHPQEDRQGDRQGVPRGRRVAARRRARRSPRRPPERRVDPVHRCRHRCADGRGVPPRARRLDRARGRNRTGARRHGPVAFRRARHRSGFAALGRDQAPLATHIARSTPRAAAVARPAPEEGPDSPTAGSPLRARHHRMRLHAPCAPARRPGRARWHPIALRRRHSTTRRPRRPGVSGRAPLSGDPHRRPPPRRPLAASGVGGAAIRSPVLQEDDSRARHTPPDR